MLKVWNVGLLLASFTLAIFGTFVVRSGLIQSVHTFAVSQIGPYFLGFLVAVLVLSIGLMIWRLPMMQSDNGFDSMLSRESGFLLNNLVFAGIAFATFWGTVYPLVSEAVRGETLTVGPPFYEQVNGPLFLIMLILMGVGPLLAWRRSEVSALLRTMRMPLIGAVVVIVAMLVLFGQPMAAAGAAAAVFSIAAVVVEYWRGARLRKKNAGDALPVAVYRLARRDPRRYGGYVVHLGVAIIAIGIIGSTFFQTERRVVLNEGQSVEVAEYTLVYQGLADVRQRDARVVTASIDVQVDGDDKGVIQAKRFFYNGFENQPTTQVATETVGFDDVYVMLTEWTDDGQANLHIFINPLVPWIWAGGLIYLFGMVVVFWPAPQVSRVRATVPARGSGKALGDATT
jgi:cytochrome c-type biogenesis protein CcmF